MKLGWIGLGDMGQVIIPRLLEAGHEVTGWNRTASKADALIEKGMAWADTPREVAATIGLRLLDGHQRRGGRSDRTRR